MVSMRADQHARVRDTAQHRIQAIAPSARFDRVAPNEHSVDAAQLCRNLVGEVVVVDGWPDADPCGREGVEQRGEAAFGRSRAIAHRAVTRIQQCQ
jgi:hypothetical protein